MNLKVFVAELIGTFALVFIGAGAAALGAGGLVGVAFAHGLVLLVFVYAFGAISGAHINPAVTFGVALAGELDWSDAATYWIAQFVGGALGAAALAMVLGGTSSGLGATVLADGVKPYQGIAVEAILTFFLVNTVLQTAYKGKSSDMAGVAIGLTLTFGILLGGPLTGGSLNPARTLGPALFTDTQGQIWIYFLGTGLGAALAAGLERFLK